MDEDFIMPLIVFSFLLAMLWMILSHVRWKHSHKAGGGAEEGGSLRTSELKQLVIEAVAEANRPLHERIAGLEKQVRRNRQLPSHQADPILEEVGEEVAEAAKVSRGGRAT